MKVLNKKYRCIMPANEKGITKSDINVNSVPTLDHDTAMIYCWNGKVSIGKEDRAVMVAYIFGSNIFNKIVDSMNKSDLEIIDSYLLDGEGFVKFRRKDVNEVAKICRAKKQRKQPVGISNYIDNYPYYLRIMTNVSSRYKRELDKFKKMNNSRNQKDGDNN